MLNYYIKSNMKKQGKLILHRKYLSKTYLINHTKNKTIYHVKKGWEGIY